MEREGYKEALSRSIDPTAMIKEMPTDKMWLLIGELDDILEDFERELAVSYVSSNHSEIKHLCVTYLRGQTDDFIRETMLSIRQKMKEELSRRKKERIIP